MKHKAAINAAFTFCRKKGLVKKRTYVYNRTTRQERIVPNKERRAYEI